MNTQQGGSTSPQGQRLQETSDPLEQPQQPKIEGKKDVPKQELYQQLKHMY